MAKLTKMVEVVKSPSAFDSFSNYVGRTDFDDLYCVVTQNRDSDILTRSNFTVALEMLGGESDNVEVHRFGHWACGWWEMIAVKANTPEYAIAEQIAEELENYPILDESHYSELEMKESDEYWASLPLSERVDICRENGVSIFAARHDYMPSKPNGEYVVNIEG